MEPVFARAAAEVERRGIPGLAVGVLAGESEAVRAFGVANAVTGEPVTPETTFRVASITKPFVAALAARTLDLEAPLPLPAGGEADVRQLLSHSAGLACETPAPLGIPPGTLFSYSNAGYWLVGEAIARACGTTFEEAMEASLLGPLGLRTTSFDPPAAVGHEAAARPYPRPDYPRARRPSGGLVSTAGDLLRFARAQLDDPAAAGLREPLVAIPGGRYGTGWMVEGRAGTVVASHPGSAAGFTSLLALVPERRLAVAALANSSEGRQAIRKVVGTALGVAGLPADPPRLAAPGAADLAPLAGRYRGAELEATVSVDGDRVRIAARSRDPFAERWEEEPPFVARPLENGELLVVEGEAEGDRIDFPRGRLRLSWLLAERVP